jgi:Rps23 Pro-64 3,4-dihydroxylase Tpa1-like proline 4-hydroxylase
MINWTRFEAALATFGQRPPFDFCVVDDFFEPEIADALAGEFPDYDSPKWFGYKNAIEDKKALNDWNAFPSATYKAFNALYSDRMISILEELLREKVFPDHGLHGGGWHIHGTGGNLNPHLDYSIHPKMDKERKLNIIVYMSKEMRPEYGGHLGLWANDDGQPGQLIEEVEPKFNRAILFDTTRTAGTV